MPDDFDPYALQYADEPTAAEMARARIQALRGQQNLGLLLQLTGDKTIAPVGQHLSGQADAGEKFLGQAPDLRAKMQLHRETMLGKKQEREDMEDPAVQQMARDLTKQAGVDVPEDTPARPLLKYGAPLAEKLISHRDATQARRDVAETRADAQRQAAEDRAAQRKAADETKATGKADKDFMAFGNALNLAKGRQGEAGKAMGTLNQVERDLALIEQNPNPTAQQLYEIARGLDRAISGAAPTIGATTHLMPQTLMGGVRDIQQMLTNEPTGRGQQKFVAQMKDTLERIKAKTQEFANKTMGQTVNTYAHLAKIDEPRFKSAILAATLDPEHFDQANGWLYKGAPKAQPADPAVEHYRAQLKPGERLAKAPDGKVIALGKDEATPAGFTEIR